MTTDIQTTDARDLAKVAESLVTKGDLSALTAAERARHYIATCASHGLNPNSQPFSFLTLNGKLVMYANRGCTDQLAAMHHVNRRIIRGPEETSVGGQKLVICVAEATMPNGRVETAIATVPMVDPVNVLMKAETKAKRRATLSILGLGILDETEVETTPGAVRIDAPQVERPQLDGAPAQPAPLDALDAFRRVVAECTDLATIAAAYQGSDLGGTSAKAVADVVRERTAKLGYHLNAADVTALLGGSMPAGTALAYDRLACVTRHADDEDGDSVVAEVVRVLRDVGGLDAPTRIKTAAVATCTALDVADAAKRIAAALRPTPPDGGPSGTRTPASPAPADATAAPLATAAANDAPAMRTVIDADETERRLVTSAPAWAAYLAERVAAQVPVFALCGSYWKRREAFAAEGVAVARYDATLAAIEAREGKGRDAAREALDGYRTRRVMPRGAGEVVQLPRRGDLRATG